MRRLIELVRTLELTVLAVVLLSSSAIVIGQQQPPTVTHPSTSNVQVSPQRGPSPYGNAPNPAVGVQRAQGAITGFVYWQMNVLQPSSSCNGLTVKVVTVSKSGMPLQLLSSSNTFTAMGPVTDTSAPGTPKYMLCSYAFQSMPENVAMRVLLYGAPSSSSVSMVLGNLVSAQHAQKPLTNDDVIAMVHKRLPESVIVSAIQAGPSKFSTSTNELIRLNAAGVTEKELNAILAASGGSASSGVSANAPGNSNSSAEAMPPSKSRMPRLMVTQGSSTQELKLEKTQLAETKTKPSSMKALAADSAVTQAMQAGVNTATYSAATHMNSGIGGSAVQQAGSIFSGVMSHRTPTVTYVWGVPSPNSSNILQNAKPSFTLDFSRTIGVTADEYEPAIVKLTPAQNTCRIVGATQGKEDVRSTPAADWQMYSHFLEERVSSTPQKLGPGKYKIAANSELVPGEYGIVLRPVSKGKKFSGGDVARAQGDGLMFDAIWTFQISEDAE